MKSEIKKVAIITSGGDAPGMNLAVSMILEQLSQKNVDVYFGFEGYKGLFENQIYGPFTIKNIDNEKIIVDQNDILKSINLKEFKKSGSFLLSSRFKKLDVNDPDTINIKNNLANKGINDLFVIGGDGSMMGAQVLTKLGLNTYVIPATIDNDFLNSEITIGASSAANTNRIIINSLIDTSKTHKAIHLLEIMGRGSPWLTNESVGGLNLIAKITNENKFYSPQEVFDLIKDKIPTNTIEAINWKYEPLIAIQELIYDEQWYQTLVDLIKNNTIYNARYTKIGYIQRGAFTTSKEKNIVEGLVKKMLDFYLSKQEFKTSQQHVVIKNKNNEFIVYQTI